VHPTYTKMKNTFSPFRAATAAFLALNFLAQSVFATCGGGGGGGMGGSAPGGGSVAYVVPWVVTAEGNALPKAPAASLIVLWFPVSAKAAADSDLRSSSVLTLAAARCVADVLITSDNKTVRAKYGVTDAEAAILIRPDGTEIARATLSKKNTVVTSSLERALNTEIKTQEKAITAVLTAAEKKVKAKDQTAQADLEKVWAERCLFPSLGKRAAKGLKTLGINVDGAELKKLGSDNLADPDVSGVRTAAVERIIKAGLKAEIAGDYVTAGKRYKEATELDPADTTALRFLGEYYRHQTGQWDLAGRVFNRILAQPADPVARAVALHGLGKMTIHSGNFAAGLAKFHESLEVFPLAITYRNLAVYWFSEKETDKAAGYMREAFALEPNDQYNQIFAAVYLAAAGKKDEALAIAKDNEKVLEASYNLAAIYAQAGDKKKAMEYLRRHFETYERYDAVRAMEMKEARDDYMFIALHQDPDFIALTKLARNAWMIGNEFCDPISLLASPEAPLRRM
jgi:tetratricopeptide (TPR) repeat protein